jgi:hypothetical protein
MEKNDFELLQAQMLVIYGRLKNLEETVHRELGVDIDTRMPYGLAKDLTALADDYIHAGKYKNDD